MLCPAFSGSKLEDVEDLRFWIVMWKHRHWTGNRNLCVIILLFLSLSDLGQIDSTSSGIHFFIIETEGWHEFSQFCTSGGLLQVSYFSFSRINTFFDNMFLFIVKWCWLFRCIWWKRFHSKWVKNVNVWDEA